jgi:hypothetical protein
MTVQAGDKQPKDLRYRRQFFPNADELIFDTSRKGFVPLPIILRKALRHLTSPELRVLVYLQLRASRFGICYPTLDEIVHELGLTGKKNLLPHLKSLEEKKFISRHNAAGKTFFLVHDPRVGLLHLAAVGELSEQEAFEINELCADLNQPPLAFVMPKESEGHEAAGHSVPQISAAGAEHP